MSHKIIAQNHQFIGVNKGFASYVERGDDPGKLGVFCQTQGPGKSFPMIFYNRKILRKCGGSPNFVVVTDRGDLDGQIYRTFLATGTVKKRDAAQPKNGEEMRKFLGQSKRLVFTLIQKFHWPKAGKFPLLPECDEIIVIDYYGVRLKKALNDYGEGADGEDAPVKDKDELFRLLNGAIAHGRDFCKHRGAHIDQELENNDIFAKVSLFDDWANLLLGKDERRKAFNVFESTNSGSSSTDRIFDELTQFMGEMSDEDERHTRFGLTEDEQEIYDFLKKEKMTQTEEKKVRLAAMALMKRLLEEVPKVLVQDWFKDAQARPVVRDAVGEGSDKTLPDSYDRDLFAKKRDSVFELVLDLAEHGAKWAAQQF